MRTRLNFSAVIALGVSAAMGGSNLSVTPTIPGATTGSLSWKTPAIGSMRVLPNTGVDKIATELIDNTENIPVAIHDGRKLLLVTDYTHKGLVLIHSATLAQVRITDGLNSGYDAAFSPDGRYVGYKAFQDAEGGRLQAAMIYNVDKKENLNLSGWQPRTGTTTISANGKIGFTVGRTLFILNNQFDLEQKVELDGIANLVNFSADGGRVAYAGLEGQVHAVNLSDGKDAILSAEGHNFWGPAFSADGKKLLASTMDGDVAVLSSQSDGTPANFLASGATDRNAEPFGMRLRAHLRNPVWLGTNTVGFLKIAVTADAQEHRQVYSMDLASKTFKTFDLRSEDGNVLIGKQSLLKIRSGVLSRAFLDQSLFGSNFQWSALAPMSGSSILPLLNSPRNIGGMLPLSGPLAKSASESAVRDSVMISGVPYLAQSYDTRDGWAGGSACGATSAVMTLAYYDKLPKHPMTVQKSVTHNTDYGFYITEKYSMNGTNFNLGSPDPNGVMGYGGFGYITKNNWADTKQYMADFIGIHGPQSEVDWSPTLNDAKREIDATHPFVVLNSITSAGHYIVAIGYMKGTLDGTLIYNDPAGNRNDATYSSFRRGIQAKYDLPGVNNGFANLNVAHCFVYARAEMAATGLRHDAASLAWHNSVEAELVNMVGAKVKAGKGLARGGYLDISLKVGNRY